MFEIRPNLQLKNLHLFLLSDKVEIGDGNQFFTAKLTLTQIITKILGTFIVIKLFYFNLLGQIALIQLNIKLKV